MDINTLTDTFKKANEAAIAAGAANPEDGGTCNFDTPTVFFGRTSRTKVEAAAKAAGITVHYFSWMGRTACWINVRMDGQANLRSRMAEAADKVLKAAGLKAVMYYQMD